MVSLSTFGLPPIAPSQERIEGIELPKRWSPMRWHSVQERLTHDRVRYKVCAAGRRSGKTERAKRHGVMAAMAAPPEIDSYRVAFMAPTWQQVKDIYWEDLQRLVPAILVKRILKGELTIELKNGAKIQCIGMQAPARAEGSPLHAAYWDEAGDQVEGAFQKHVMPALDTLGQEGYAWIYGVPRPGGGFRELADHAMDPSTEDMAFYTWPSADILTPAQIENARSRMDPRLFSQEYEANFVNFSGRIYYPFSKDLQAVERVVYEPDLPLNVCFDFNVEPGTATVVQEQTYRGDRENVAERFTAVIDEVFIPHDSNTPQVCRKFCEDWSHHEGLVYAYGDATGGARKSSQTEGTDWDLLANELFRTFGERLVLMRANENPAERARVNSMNTRLLSADGTVHLMVDPTKCPQTIKDFEEVVAKEGTNGEIDKDPKRFKLRTHLTDGLGYYMHQEHPVDEQDNFEDEPLAI